MQVGPFISRWSHLEGGAERANYALFLTELCDVLGVPRPDPAGATTERNDYVFERAVRRAEDVDLLPEASFQGLLETCIDSPGGFAPLLNELWGAMDQGRYATSIRSRVKHFNGALFKDARAIPLEREEIGELLAAARADWTEVEPAIFGALLEQALEPGERKKLGAHYTPRAYVERLVTATIIEPLRADWSNVSDEEMIARLVALNAERAAEERRGQVRWLRPDYQKARAGIVSIGGEQTEADLALPLEFKSAPETFPRDPVEQSAAVAAADISERWRKDKRTERKIEAILSAFVRTGAASTPDGGQTFRARRAA